MDLGEYNSIMETLHITKSTANRNRLDDAIAEMENGTFSKHGLIEK